MTPVTTGPFQRLEQRIEDNARAWLATHPLLGTFVLRERDENSLVLPETALPRPVILIVAKDEGRAHKLTPIRNIKLSITVRANAMTPGGSEESYSSIGGALEMFLDTSNLQTALSGPTVAVMLGVRQPGIAYRSSDLVREGTVSVDLKAVAAELTVQGVGAG